VSKDSSQASRHFPTLYSPQGRSGTTFTRSRIRKFFRKKKVRVIKQPFFKPATKALYQALKLKVLVTYTGLRSGPLWLANRFFPGLFGSQGFFSKTPFLIIVFPAFTGNVLPV
jgi:hypothetical protein